MEPNYFINRLVMKQISPLCGVVNDLVCREMTYTKQLIPGLTSLDVQLAYAYMIYICTTVGKL